MKTIKINTTDTHFNYEKVVEGDLTSQTGYSYSLSMGSRLESITEIFGKSNNQDERCYYWHILANKIPFILGLKIGEKFKRSFTAYDGTKDCYLLIAHVPNKDDVESDLNNFCNDMHKIFWTEEHDKYLENRAKELEEYRQERKEYYAQTNKLVE